MFNFIRNWFIVMSLSMVIHQKSLIESMNRLTTPRTVEAIQNSFLLDSTSSVIRNNKNETKEFSFTILGQPVALSRHRSTKTGIMYNPSAKLQNAFLSACKPILPEIPLDGAIEAKILFYFSRPKNHYGSGKNSDKLKPGVDYWHKKKSDIDNLVKFVLDSLNKVAYYDDSQVAILNTAKLYTNGESRIEINLKKLDESSFMTNDKIQIPSKEEVEELNQSCK